MLFSVLFSSADAMLVFSCSFEFAWFDNPSGVLLVVLLFSFEFTFIKYTIPPIITNKITTTIKAMIFLLIFTIPFL